MKRIFKDKEYKVEKYTSKNEYANYGTMSGDDVHAIIKGFSYDSELDMYFNKTGSIGYSVTEC